MVKATVSSEGGTLATEVPGAMWPKKSLEGRQKGSSGMQ